jgi:hypothetical protein
MTSEEIFYCLVPEFNNQPAIKLKCSANKCDDNSMFANGYYEFSIDQKEYEQYHSNCQIKTLDEEQEWGVKLYVAIADEIENLFKIAVDVDDEQGYWEFQCFPIFVFSYVYDAYNDLID